MKRRIRNTVRKRNVSHSRRSKKDSNITSGYGGFGYGGLVNPISGAGTSLDKNSLSFFEATRLQSRNFNETIYVESWAAAKFVDIPVDDMFVKWREFCDMETENVKLVEDVEKKFKIKSRLSKAMKNARLYGTGLFIILTRDTKPENPLNVSRMMPGDLSNILSIDRFDATIQARETNPYSLNFGMPLFYRINLKNAGSIIVHHSRIIRFDGKTSNSDNGWISYDPDWGVASIIPVFTEIFQDSNVSKGVAHLVSEASIKNMKIDGFEEALEGSGDEMALSDRMAATTALMSIYRTNFMDKEDDFDRTSVNFAGLHEIIDRQAVRLAAAADIPETRFWSKSIVGMQSTGEGESRNYALKVASDQENQLPEPLDIIDQVIVKHLGLKEKIYYKFVSIMDISEKDKIENALKKSQIVVPLVTSGVIDEDEGREIMDGDEILGDFDDLGEPIEGVDDFSKKIANTFVQNQLKKDKT
ncbi:DUF1073 domain-containing protein [Candidatus Pacearchaeota archaeon]|nr:DUF1073 domain-containing protein [Candidatus Pacearchaeota archaeon]